MEEAANGISYSRAKAKLDLPNLDTTSVCLYGVGGSFNHNGFGIVIMSSIHGDNPVNEKFRPLHISYDLPLLESFKVTFVEQKVIRTGLSRADCIPVILQKLCNKKAVLFYQEKDEATLTEDKNICIDARLCYCPFAVITDDLVSKINEQKNNHPHVFFKINDIMQTFIIIDIAPELLEYCRPEFRSYTQIELHNLNQFDFQILDPKTYESRIMNSEERKNVCGTVILNDDILDSLRLYKELLDSLPENRLVEETD